MDLSNKKVLMVVAPENFRDEEYLEPRKILEENSVKVIIASIKKGRARGVGGTVVDIDLILNEVQVNDYDGVIFIGGPGMAERIEDQNLIQLAKDFYQAGKIVSAICVAPAILANGGILTGKRATCWEGAKNFLVQSGAVYTGASVEVDGKIITANGPQSAHTFGHQVAEILKKD